MLIGRIWILYELCRKVTANNLVMVAIHSNRAAKLWSYIIKTNKHC